MLLEVDVFVEAPDCCCCGNVAEEEICEDE